MTPFRTLCFAFSFNGVSKQETLRLPNLRWFYKTKAVFDLAPHFHVMLIGIIDL